MAQPTHVTVSYRRQVQPAQYEAEEVVLGGSFAVEEGEDFEAIAYDMIARAKVQAHRLLGRPVPEIAPFGEASFDTTAEEPRPAEPALAKRKRRTKAEMEAARAATATAEQQVAHQAEADIDILAEPTPGPREVATASVNGAAEDFDITADEPKEISVQDLQAAAAAASKRLGGPGPIKKILAEFGVARLSETPAGRRQAFLDALAAL